MPTLGELRALLDSQGKPICDSTGATICGHCTPPTEFDPCASQLCPDDWVCGSDDFCLQIRGWRDLGDLDPDATVDIDMPMEFWCGFETYVIFWGLIGSTSPDLSGCLCGMPNSMTVVVYCRQDTIGGPKVLEAFFLTSSCAPPEVNCGMHVNPLSVACPELSYGAFTNPDFNGIACKFAFNTLELVPGHCSPSVVASNCGNTLPPFEVVPDVPDDWQHACCPARTEYRSPIPATIVGAAAGPPFTPGCDECLTGTMKFRFLPNVNFFDLLGAGVVKPGYAGTFAVGAAGLAPPFNQDTHLLVIVYCHDGLNWLPRGAFVSQEAGVPVLEVDVRIEVPPCTDPNPNDYFEVTITMNPGTGCASGCPCYGGALIIADPNS